MSKKSFTRPLVDVVRFKSEILSASSCACFDSMFCPRNYSNCKNDGAGCECSVNYSPQLDNCIPCPTYQ